MPVPPPRPSVSRCRAPSPGRRRSWPTSARHRRTPIAAQARRRAVPARCPPLLFRASSVSALRAAPLRAYRTWPSDRPPATPRPWPFGQRRPSGSLPIQVAAASRVRRPMLCGRNPAGTRLRRTSDQPRRSRIPARPPQQRVPTRPARRRRSPRGDIARRSPRPRPHPVARAERDQHLAQRLRRLRSTAGQLGVEIWVARASAYTAATSSAEHSGSCRAVSSSVSRRRGTSETDKMRSCSPSQRVCSGSVSSSRQVSKTNRPVAGRLRLRWARKSRVDTSAQCTSSTTSTAPPAAISPHRAHHRLDGPGPTRGDRRERLAVGTETHPEYRVQSAVRHRAGQRRTRTTQDP